MKVHSIKDLSHEERRQLLQALGFDHDGKFVTHGDGSTYLDPYTKKPVPVDNLAILPGDGAEAIVLDNNEVSICGYVSDYLTR